MLIYRDDGTVVNTTLELARLQRAAAKHGRRCHPDDAVALLIAIGEFESALADARLADGNAAAIECTSARDATIEAARVWMRACRNGIGDTDALVTSLARLTDFSLPSSITLRVSEGFAYYALFPETYVLAAERYVAEVRPASVVVLGIRSIGATLSAVVAAALERTGCPMRSWTVRPGGHPFDRRLSVSRDLAAVLGARAAEGASFAIVDEGPGLSGSSFASVIDALEGLGIDPSRIVLFPSWDADADRLLSARAQSVWRTHKRYCIVAREAGIFPEDMARTSGTIEDWSGGRWRQSVYAEGETWPAVQAQHERWKMLLTDERRLIRFAGLGQYGTRIALRAETLFEAGLADCPGDLRGGFLDVPFVTGTPLVSGTVTATEACEIGRYIGRVARLFRMDSETDAAILMPMLQTNVSELLHESGSLPSFVPGPIVNVDGRMLAHEWLRTPDGLRKIDALDHHCDHFFAGATDPAWDIAGAAIELALDETCERALLAEYARVSGDAHVSTRLPFYRAAYAAFRGGYCAMQADALESTPEGERFDRARDRYIEVLRRWLPPLEKRPAPVTPSAP